MVGSPDMAVPFRSQQVADELRAAIEGGDLPPGARLPSYRDLVARHGIAQNTAREAIRLLVAEGHVVVEHGRGAFVRKHEPLMRLSGDRYSDALPHSTPFREECKRLGREARIDVLSIDQVLAPTDVIERLQISADAPVLRRYSCYFADDSPVQVVTAYIAWEDAVDSQMLEPNTGPGGIYGRLEERGHTLRRSRDEVSARMPHAAESKLLHLPNGTPVLDVLHTGFDQNGSPFEVIHFVMRGDQSGVLIDQEVRARAIEPPDAPDARD